MRKVIPMFSTFYNSNFGLSYQSIYLLTYLPTDLSCILVSAKQEVSTIYNPLMRYTRRSIPMAF